jgi:alkylation response protein AidB-like acyl-CoA dehydrogenase
MAYDWRPLIDELGPRFAERAAQHDADDSFVAENYALLRERGAFAAGIPAALGGGDASHAELCALVRALARHCSSTSLAFSMHTHLVATLSYLWRAGNQLPEKVLRKVAEEKLILVSTGGSDWLAGSGSLQKVPGGYRMNGRKIFGSGVPAGDLLLTTGIYDDPQTGPTVIHFPVPLDAPGVKVLDTWRVLGMRGTGSHDIELADVFVPDAAMGGVRRPPGVFHPFMQTVAVVALPVIYAAYLGVAEAARDLALKLAARKQNDPLTAIQVGEMENELVAAQLAHAGMVDLVVQEKVSPATTSATLCRRTLVARAVIATVERALVVAGGASFYRSLGLERLFRDIQGARYHPVPETAQTRLTGRFLLGLGIDTPI